MKQLFMSEWQRMWKRKSTWFCFSGIPIILLLFVKLYLNKNQKMGNSNTNYVNFLNFPNIVLSQQLTIFYNIIVLVLIVMSITKEYRTGELRMVMTRAVSFLDIIKVKILVISSVILIFLISNLILSTFFGYIFFSHSDVKPRMYGDLLTISQGVLYNIKFYFIAFITLIAVMSVVMVICIVCKTSTGALGGGFTYILASALYPEVISLIIKEKAAILDFSSLISIQDHGIYSLLAQKPEHVGLIIFVIGLYLIVFSSISFILFKDSDFYM